MHSQNFTIPRRACTHAHMHTCTQSRAYTQPFNSLHTLCTERSLFDLPDVFLLHKLLWGFESERGGGQMWNKDQESNSGIREDLISLYCLCLGYVKSQMIPPLRDVTWSVSLCSILWFSNSTQMTDYNKMCYEVLLHRWSSYLG